MKVRELLQTELWGRRTSRKILVGIAVVIGLFYGGAFVWNQVQLHWLTTGERTAARSALWQIEALQNDGSLSDSEFDTRAKELQAQLKAAQDAAKTYRDHFVEMRLDSYFSSVVWERRKIRRAHLAAQGKLALGERDRELEEKIDATIGSWKFTDRLALHKELD